MPNPMIDCFPGWQCGNMATRNYACWGDESLFASLKQDFQSELQSPENVTEQTNLGVQIHSSLEIVSHVDRVDTFLVLKVFGTLTFIIKSIKYPDWDVRL